MKKLYPFLILFLISTTISFAQNVMFYDANFKNALLGDPNINTNGDGEISIDEAMSVVQMNVSYLGITDLTGIEEFTNLTALNCTNNFLSTLDVRDLTSLENLNCYDNNLTSLKVSGLTNLRVLSCFQNSLTHLDVSGLTKLEELQCFSNELTSLVVSGTTNLSSLDCSFNYLESLDVSSLTNLFELQCQNNLLPSLDVSGLANLVELYCHKNNLTSLNVSGATNLTLLACHKNSLTDLDASGLANLVELYCFENNLTSLNVNGTTNLKSISCYDNYLTSLDVSDLTNLEGVFCFDNELTSLNVSGATNLKNLACHENYLPSLDVSGLTNLEKLFCYRNDLISLNLSGLINLDLLSCFDNSLTSLDVRGLTNLKQLACEENELTSLDIRNTGAITSITAIDNPDLECIVVDDLMNVPASVSVDQSHIPYSTTPCIIMDFDDLSNVIDDSGISPYLAATLDATAAIAEESCSQGSKNTAIYTLASLKLMVKRSRQIGRLNAAQASELTDGIDMLIDNLRSGAVDCKAQTGEKKNILDWIKEWFGYNLETPEVADNNTTFDTRSHTVQSVYPNPTSGRVNFAQPDQQVVVYNMLGKVMQKAEGTDHVDLSTYQPGVYVIQLLKGEERSVHQVVKR